MNNRFYKIVIVSLVMLTGFMAEVYGQEVGSKLPDLSIGGAMINGSKKSTIKEMYEKGGLIINFWATWCSPCLKEQKMLDSLMQVFPDLSVLSTTYEDSILVRKHFDKIGLPKSKSMVITANDKLFHDFFKHRMIPHNIWIDKQGVIRAVTGGEEINEKNIKEFFNGNVANLYAKVDDMKFEFTKTYHVPDSMILFRSYISGMNDAITSGLLYGNEKEFNRVFAWNRPITQFFWLAFTNLKSSRMNWNLIELHSSDSTRFIQPQLDKPLFERSRYNNGNDLLTRQRKWDKDNIYCYELILPKNVDVKLASEYMLPDLEKFFNIKASTKKKRVVCNVVSLNRSKLLKLPVAKGETPSFRHKYYTLNVQSKSIDDILSGLSDDFNDNIPYINNTGYNGLLSFEIKSEKGKLTLDDVWSKLNEFGIGKVKKKRLYKVLVLRDLSHPGKG
ncbi:thiol-disulfide isomerase/thioredoxin [Pedobacter cryoconitis]|uniref:Thiol-disulfide isomerase/thioredoxin n=1 Tax=Pedobacter cryoconitis TaxID=188932 RepID=A0A7W8YYP3_9SPHI|nr:TlpA disulfide reductase family protein [Pedobacter cryoconitis]MBB5624092.1 thiol-disulfide isomerase/thioredoxin [Pedobacter cryoconitis]